MLSPEELREAAESLRRLLAEVEAGEVEAAPGQVEHLRGALAVLESLY